MNKMRRCAAWVLSAAMVLGMLPADALAAPGNKTVATEEPVVVESIETGKNIIDLGNDIKFELNANTVLAEALLSSSDVTVDEADPAIIAVRAELEDMTVQNTVINDDGSVSTASSALSDEEMDMIVGMFQMYLYQRSANADVLGAQTPYYLQYNDDKDGLGPLGEMLTLAGFTVDQVRAGMFGFDDLMGLILNFYYGDYYGAANTDDILGQQLGLAVGKGGFLRSRIEARRDEAMQRVKDANCKTEAQKYFVLNEYVSAVDVMDMAFIMNKGTAASMLAEEPDNYESVVPDQTVAYINMQQGIIKSGIGKVKYISQEQFASIYNTFYSFYYPMILGVLGDQFMPLIKADARQGVYDDVYWAVASQFAGEEYADALATEQADGFMQLAEMAGGIPNMDEEGNPIMNPDGSFSMMYTWDELLDQALDMKLEQMGGLTPKQVAAMEADGAVRGLVDGIFGYWEGSLIGALTQFKSVCLGYTGALAFLDQCMHADYYTTDGNYKNPTSWKNTRELYFDKNGKLDIMKGYTADHIRIVFDAEVSMFGDVQPNFSSEHFWNACRIGNDWYYNDCCYSDVYAEVMIRDQVPADGSMNHLYFLMSHQTMAEMFEGNYSELDTFYADKSKNTQYESSWFVRSCSDSSSDGENFYYMYDSTNLLGMYRLMKEMEADDGNDNGGFNQSDMQNWQKMSAMRNPNYGVVKHPVTAPDIKDGVDVNGDPTNGADDNFTYLVQLNYKPDDNSDETYARVWVPSQNAYVKNDMLTEAFAAWQEMSEIYASAALSADYYDGVIYFTVANAIFAYDLKTGDVKCVKQYDAVVYGNKDKSIKLGGEGFTVTTQKTDYPVYNAPLAGLLIDDATGNINVSISTNYSYISGRDTMVDDTTYGYSYQESDFQREYSAYAPSEERYEGIMGNENQGKRVKNDNDEFMFSGIFKDTLTVSGIKNNNVTFKTPTCDHKFILYREKYYTKDDYENYGTGSAWICVTCGKHIVASYTDEATAADNNDQMNNYMQGIDMGTWNTDYNADLDAYVKGNTIYSIADGNWTNGVYTFSKLSGSASAMPAGFDFSQEVNAVTNITLDQPVAVSAKPVVVSGDCETGLTIKYVAEGYTSEGFYFNVDQPNSQTTLPANQHVFDGTHDDGENEYAPAWTWTDGVPAINMNNLKCVACGKSVSQCLGTVTGDKDATGEAYTQYTLSDAKTDVGAVANGSTVGRNSCTQSATSYKYVDGKIVATKKTTEYTHTHEIVTVAEEAATCTEAGSATSECTVEGCEEKKVEVIPAKGHDEETETTAPTCEEAGKIVTKCSVCGEELGEETIPAYGHTEVTETSDATCEEAGKIVTKCSECGKELANESIPAKGHTYGEDGKCTECGKEKPVVEEPIVEDDEDKAPVNASESVTSSETVTLGVMAGSTECTYSEPTGHNWSVSFDWDADGSGCVAVLKCSRCSDQEKRVLYTELDKKSVTEATCEKDGTAVYNVSINVPSGKWDTEGMTEKKSSYTAVTEQAKGHTIYVTFDWNENKPYIMKGETYNPTATLKQNCAVCGKVVDSVTVPGFVYAEMPASDIPCKTTVKVYAAQYMEDSKYPQISQTVAVLATEDHVDLTWNRVPATDPLGNEIGGFDDVQTCGRCGDVVQTVPVGLTVNYVNGETVTTDVFRAGTADSYALSALMYKKTGFHQNAWDGSDGNTYADQADITALVGTAADYEEIASGKTLTLKTHWVRNTFTLVFKPGTDATGEMKDQKISYNKSEAINANKFKRTGYHFKGWKAYRSSDKKYYGKNADGKTGWYKKADIASYVYLADGAEAKKLTSVNKNTITLTAMWTANTFTVKFKPGTDATGTMKDITVTYNKSKTLTANKFKRTGYHFKGWKAYNSTTKKYYGKNSSGKTGWYAKDKIDSYVYLKDEADVKKLTSTNKASVTLTAQWTVNKFTIKFSKNSDKAKGTMSDQTVTYNKSKTLTANKFTRSGYTFKNWKVYSSVNKKYLAKNKDGKKVWASKKTITDKGYTYVYLANKAEVKTLSTTNNDKITLYAQWKKK